MVGLQELKGASMIQLKNWSFALSYQLKSRLHGQLGKYAGLYKQAKDNLGCKSLVFGLDKYQRLMHKEDDLGYFFAMGMLASLEIHERKLRATTRRIQPMMVELLHEGIGDREWRDVTTDLKECRTTYHENTRHVAAKFWEEEKQDVLLILSDSLEEFDGAMFEADHFRQGFHGLSCPVIQRIVKGLV